MSKLKLFNDLVAKLTADVTSLNSIALFKEQWQHAHTITYPCCFIGFNNRVDWQTKQLGVQSGNVMVTMHLGFDTTTTTETAMYALIDQVYASIHHYEEDEYTPILRVEERMDTEYNNVAIWEVDYVTYLIDTEANRMQNLVQATVDPEVSKVDLLKIFPVVTDVTAAGYTDGSIVLNLQGGLAPVTYVWNTGATNENLTNVEIGEYTVLITDAMGTQLEETFAVAGFNPLFFEPSLWLDPNDNGYLLKENDGSVDRARTIFDKSQKLALGPEIHTEAVENWDFIDSLAWSAADGVITGIGGGSFGQIWNDYYDPLFNAQGKYFELTFEVTEFTSGKIRAGVGGYDWTPLTGEGVGTYTHTLEVVNVNANRRFYFLNYTFIGKIANITLKQIQGNHATQVIEANQFAFSTINTRQYLRAEANHFLSVLSDSSLENGNFSLFYVIKTDDKSNAMNGGIAKGETFAVSEADYSFTAEMDNSTLTFAISDDTSSDSVSATLVYNDMQIIEFRSGATEIGLYINGALMDSVSRTVTTDYSSHFDLLIGSQADGTDGLQGEIGDILLFPKALSDGESQYIVDGLFEKHGFTWTLAMVESYKEINAHADYPEEVLAELRHRLMPGGYLHTTFGPGGQNKTTCDFLLLFEFYNDIGTTATDKTGDALRWDMDDLISLQNSVPDHSFGAGSGLGICTVSSTDGWGGISIFRLASNNFNGFLPKCSFPNATHFYVYSNNFSGACPDVDMPNLQYLYLYLNNFSGEIPNFQCPLLKRLWIQQNNFSGEIPNFNFPLQEYFYIRNNNFSGPCPNFNFPLLKAFYIYTNNFSGNLPFFDFPLLTNFRIQSNNFTGPVHNFNFPLVQYFYVGANELSGEVPNWNFPNLLYLYLYRNNFTGPLPDFNYPLLRRLYAYINQFSGPCPALANCTALELVQLQTNNFSGACPNFNFPVATMFLLGGNNFSGSCPNFNLPLVETFDINNSGFSGNLPNFNFPAAIIFYVYGNLFSSYSSGTIGLNITNYSINTNYMDAAGVNNILADFVTNMGSRVNCAITLNGFANAAPTGQGVTDKATLQANGFTVTTN